MFITEGRTTAPPPPKKFFMFYTEIHKAVQYISNLGEHNFSFLTDSLSFLNNLKNSFNLSDTSRVISSSINNQNKKNIYYLDTWPL